MAVTRIKNNQITDSTVNAAAKLQDYTITSSKIANNLTYSSSLTVTGNLTVQGNTTTISTVDLQVEDPLILLAEQQTGSPSLDIGYIGKRGTSNNIAFVWQESTSEFITAYTTSVDTDTTITVSSYANLKSNNIYANGHINADGNLTVNGRSFLGNILFDPSSNIDIGNNRITNVATPVSGTDAATKDYVDGVASSGFTIEDDSANTTVVSGGDTLSLLGTANEVTVAITATDEITFGLPDNVTVTANLSSGNLLTGGVVSSTGNITGGNIRTGGVVSSTGNITGGNVLTGGVVSATGNVNGGNLISAALVQGVTLSASGNVVAGNVTTTGLVSATGNITGGNLLTGGITSSTGNLVTGANLVVSGYATVTGNVTGGNLLTGGLISSTGNVTGGNILTGGVVSATGNVNGGNLISAALVQGVTVSASGNVIGGNVNTAGTMSATGNITGGNIITGGYVSATGNVNGGNVNTAVVRNGSGALTVSTGTGDLNLQPAGNVVLANTYVNSVAYPVQDQDAASKIYVDNMVSTQLAYHQAVVAASTTTMATTTGGTVSYNNGTSGVGATLTTTGSFNLIDTANVQTLGTRILIKNEANAVWNGVYTWANSTTVVRSSDTDSYGPNATDHLSINDYFFVSGGDVNKGSAWICDAPTGVITFGVSNIGFAQFSSSQTYTAGNGISLVGTVITAKVDNNTTAFDGSGNIIVKAGANLTTPNIGAATGTSLSLTGNATAGNVNTGGQVSATGTITGGNLATGGTASATGNITGGNLLTSGLISSTGNLTSGNVNTGGIVSATGNVVTGANLVASGYATVTGNITGGNVLTGGLVSATANITGGNVLTGGLMSATGNITGGNLITGGLLTATGNVNTAAGVLATGNVTGGNINTAGIVNATGNVVTGANLVASGYATVTGNITGGNLLTSGLISSTGNLTSGNVLTGGVVSATGNVNGGNVISSALVQGVTVSASGNVIGGNVTTVGLMSATGNITGGNLLTGGLISATGNITGGNITTAGQANLGNIRISGDNITDTNGRVNFNTALGAVDFAVNGGAANIFYVSAASNSTSFGNSTQVTNAIAAFQTTTSIKIPVGSTSERPGTGVTGMVRFNTSLNNLEFYDANSWQTAGSQFTVITANTQTGDGSKVAFTLPADGTTAGTIVSINGVVQIPITAYSVSGNVLTFTEAPLSSDVIDFRQLATTSEVTAIAGISGSYIQADDTAIQIDIQGNLVPTGNLVYSLGDATNFWKSLYVGGNSIYLGSLILKDAGSNTFAVYTSDGTTQANLDVGTIDVSSINSGTSVIGISGTNGNAYMTVGGTANVLVASTAGVAVTGTLSASGNITGGNINTAGLVSATGNVRGGNLISAGIMSATSTVFGAGLSIGVGGAQVTGNITGGNLLTGGLISSTGNITGGNISATTHTGTTVSVSGNVTGGNILTGGLISSTGNITGGNIITGGSMTITGASQAASYSASGNVTGGNLNAGNITINGDTISSLGSTLTIDPSSVGNTGLVVIAGNLQVNGNTTTINSNVVSTNDLTVNYANNAINSSAANGGGIEVGPIGSPYITWLYNSTANTWTTGGGISATGNITGGNLSVGTGTITGGNIVNSNANGVGNIGSSTTYFNTVFAKATSAQYADLAEKYTADAEYAPGTVVAFGGSAEVTISDSDLDRRVAGVISTNPSYIMNGGLESAFVATVALTGRVPTRVVGTVRKGDLMVSAGNGCARAEQDPRVGTVIGKALEDFDGDQGLIEVVVGRL